MTLVLRLALESDVGSLGALNQSVQKLHSDALPLHFRAETDKAEVEAFFGQAILAPNMVLVLAELDERPVGCVLFEIQTRRASPFTHARKQLYIHHIVVEPAARGSGVGKAMIRAVEQAAQVEGMSEIVLDTWAFNEEAQAFFKTSGFTPLNIIMRKPLA